MKIKNKQLLGLPVVTASGQSLGKVCGWELDTDTHQIEKYEVKTSGFIAHPFANILLINNSQIIDISLKRVVVEDNVARLLTRGKEEKSQPLKDPKPISMSKN